MFNRDVGDDWIRALKTRKCAIFTTIKSCRALDSNSASSRSNFSRSKASDSHESSALRSS